jgi:hypothetical protein
MRSDGERSNTSMSVIDINGNNSPVQSSAGTPEEVRERERMKLQVLSRKAAERTAILKVSSDSRIGLSKKLVYESAKKRDESAKKHAKSVQALERHAA